jgi:hypothetical protein
LTAIPLEPFPGSPDVQSAISGVPAMMSLLPLLERLTDAQNLACGIGAVTLHAFARHALPKLIDRGPAYIEQVTAYKIAMHALRREKDAPAVVSSPPIVFPLRPPLPEVARAEVEEAV